MRFYRRRWQLTQEELAFLFGYSDQSIVARFEQDERAITLAVAHGCELIFGVEPKEIFPTLFESVEESLVNRLHDLYERLSQAEPTQRTLAKLELLQSALKRLTATAEQEA